MTSQGQANPAMGEHGAIRKPWRHLNWPNRISILRLIFVPPFLLLVLNTHRWPWARHAALGVFVLLALSDAVDGLLARRMGISTRLGAILDPLADKVLIISAVILLAFHKVEGEYGLPNWVALAVVAKDVWVVVGAMVVYLVTDRLRIRPTWAGKLSTFGQAVLITVTLLAPEADALSRGAGRVGILAASWVVATLSVLAIISYTRLGLRFVVAEGKPLDSNQHDEGRSSIPSKTS